ncbi:hypothetical protein OPV22_024724 [Ensete ventricosum]|uniref:SUI1 domain-containing protein n=1 Tax=Ensete ventricosum TaxID=4639 RepID=A0AAV8P8X1_ENSVE|nr:hypothetical protein OPV22_024724 [Ensete ventricosum]
MRCKSVKPMSRARIEASSINTHRQWCFLDVMDGSSQEFMSDLNIQLPSAFCAAAEWKCLITLHGLKKEFSYNKILKDLKKELYCNGTVVQDPELGQVIQLQAYQQKSVSSFLV